MCKSYKSAATWHSSYKNIGETEKSPLTKYLREGLSFSQCREKYEYTCKHVTPYNLLLSHQSSISDKTLRVTSHIDEHTTPINNAPKTLSTGIREGICVNRTGQLEDGLRFAKSRSGVSKDQRDGPVECNNGCEPTLDALMRQLV